MALIAPAVCDDCGAVFPSGFAFGPGASNIRMTGNKSGPCPRCSGMGSVPDGVYDTLGDTLNIVSTWSPDRINGLVASLEEARDAPNPLAATQEVLAKEQELWRIASRFVPSPTAFWAFVTALFTILLYFKKT